MKRFLAALGLCVAVCSSALAADAVVQEARIKADKLDIAYPVFSLENQAAESKINAHVRSAVKAVQNYYKKDKELVAAGMKYEVTMENDKYLCFKLQSFDYHGGAHGMYYTNYKVFDKDTGAQLKYTDFVPALTKEQLHKGIKDKSLPVVSEDGKTVSEAPFLDSKLEVTDNFCLNSDGTISLVYGPYVLDCYAFGDAYVVLKK